MLLPYIKVNEEETYLDAPIANDSIFYVPIGDHHYQHHPQHNGFGYGSNGPMILNDHNYHFNTMNDTNKCQNIGLYCNVAEESKM